MGEKKESNSKKTSSSLKNSDLKEMKPGDELEVKPPPPPAVTPTPNPAAGKAVHYDAKTDTFHITMTNDGNPGLLENYQKQMEEAKETCKGDAAPSVIESCKK